MKSGYPIYLARKPDGNFLLSNNLEDMHDMSEGLSASQLEWRKGVVGKEDGKWVGNFHDKNGKVYMTIVLPV